MYVYISFLLREEVGAIGTASKCQVIAPAWKNFLFTCFLLSLPTSSLTKELKWNLVSQDFIKVYWDIW
jgi:hypothetical protein